MNPSSAQSSAAGGGPADHANPATRLRCYLIGTDQPLQPVDLAPHEPPPRGIVHWVDIEASDRSLLEDVLVPYELHPLLLDAFTAPGQVSRVMPVNRSLFLEFSVVESWDHPQLRRLSIFHRDDLLITVHTHPIPGLQAVIDGLGQQPPEDVHTTSTLLYQLLDRVVDDTFRMLMIARSAIVDLNDLYDEEPDDLEDRDIHGTRRAIGRLAMACEDQYYAISALQALDQNPLHLTLPREYVRDLLGHAEYANRYVTRLDDRAKELKFLLSTNVQQRSESRLRTLTILMAVFNPLTFIAGIYGMNFQHMPELSWAHGYPFAIGLMALVAGLLLILFWRRGWFD